jgi:hypothetical protein
VRRCSRGIQPVANAATAKTMKMGTTTISAESPAAIA